MSVPRIESMKHRNLDEQPNNAPILDFGKPLRVRGSSPIYHRKLAWKIRRHPREAAQEHCFLILPDGHSNILRPSERAAAKQLKGSTRSTDVRNTKSDRKGPGAASFEER